MGRRFPSIRLKSKDKKDAKKILAFSASDKAEEVNGAKGSCVRAASAIYGDEPSKLQGVNKKMDPLTDSSHF